MEVNGESNTQGIIQDLDVSVADITNPMSIESKISAEDIEKAQSVLELAARKEELKGKSQDREQRRNFAQKIFWVVVFYLGVVLFIVFFNGKLTEVSDTVLITLLGTTTANVISLLVYVAKYLFHR